MHEIIALLYYLSLNIAALIYFNPIQATLIGLNDSYHSLASPTNVRQKHWTLIPFGNACVFIQSFVMSRCASTSSSGFPENSGLKCDQFNCGIC